MKNEIVKMQVSKKQIDKFQMENEMLVDTNVNLMNKIKLIEKESKMRCVGLVIFYSLYSKINYL